MRTPVDVHFCFSVLLLLVDNRMAYDTFVCSNHEKGLIRHT